MGNSASTVSYVSAPYYPTPYGGVSSGDAWATAWDKAAALVSGMTLAEKTNITAGTGYFMGRPCVGNTGSADQSGFPQLCLQDGPLGVRTTGNVTAFPAGITTGATWDKSLMYQRGVALAEEFKGKGINVYLGPVVGPLGRKPLGGRNWEGFGADPVLQAVGGAETIKGVQDNGVIACLKHFIGYEQEMYRMYTLIQEGYSSNIDDRTMHEMYLWPFAEGVHAGVASVMTSYNGINGTQAAQHAWGLNYLLKDELGFQGMVMTDWISQTAGVDAALAGLDLSMPGDGMIPLIGEAWWMDKLTTAVLNGSVPVDRLNDMATRIVAAWYLLGQDEDYPTPNFSSWTTDEDGEYYPGALLSPSGQVNWYVDVQGDHATIAKQVAQDAVTLLKNNDSFLPISTESPLFVFGIDAETNPDGANACTDQSCDNGIVAMGWGSGSGNFPYLDDPITSLKKKASNVTYYHTDTFPTVATPGSEDIAIVFINSDSGENSYTVEDNHGDRDASQFAAWHSGDALVEAAAAKYDNVIVVVHTVGPIIMESWIDLPSVKAVVVAHLPGQEAGDSLTEILFGDVSPSGHLPYSIPTATSDYPSSVSLVSDVILVEPEDDFTEGLYIDYRYMNYESLTPRYAFGHGLSYTTFNFTDVTISSVTSLTSTPPATSTKAESPIAEMNTTIPDPSEATYPTGFNTIWRYLYSYLSASDAQAAYKIGSTQSSTYPYPDGYSTTQKTTYPPAGGANGGNPALWDTAYTVSVKVTNTGSTYSGKAVAQLYLEFPDGISYNTPQIQLRDFEKTSSLAPGASETLTLTLTRKDMSVWDTASQNWVVPDVGGRYKIWLGQASDDLGVVCYSDTLECEESS